MKIKLTIALLLLSITCSALLSAYWFFSQELSRTLTSREWMQNTVLILPKEFNQAASEYRLMERVNVSSTTKFLQDGVFIKNLSVQVYQLNQQGEVDLMPPVEFSIDGVWELVDNYLVTKNTSINNLPTARGMALSSDEVENLRKRIIILEEETKRVDKLAKDKLLLTSLNQDSQLLYAE